MPDPVAGTHPFEAAKSDVAAISEAMFEMIGQALMSGETVKLTAFGSLQVRSRAERIGRNPRTGTEHRIPPRYTVVFTPSAQLRDGLTRAKEAGELQPARSASVREK